MTDAPRLSVHPDWRAYFRAFCEAHGRPLTHKGRLLFPDGWQYSSTDHRGPEWPPPSDERELLLLRKAYWNLRRVAVRNDLVPLKLRLAEIEAMRSTRSERLPLKLPGPVNPETGLPTVVRGADAEQAVNDRVAWLEADMQQCLDVLRETELELLALDLPKRLHGATT